MFKQTALILLITLNIEVGCTAYIVYPGTYLSVSPTQALACGSISLHQVWFQSSYFTAVGKTISYFVGLDFICYDNFSGVMNTSGNTYADTITANGYTGLEDGSSVFRFGSSSSLINLKFLPIDFYEARVLTRDMIVNAEAGTESFSFRYTVDVKKSPITVTSVVADNNYYKSSTCLTIILTNPCVYLPPTTIFKITIPKISYPNNTTYEVTPMSVFNVSTCDVTLNNQTNTTKTCSLSGDILSINNLITTFTNTSNLTLRICNIKINNVNEADSKIELVNSLYTSPSNLFADANFNFVVDLGSKLPRYITSEKTAITSAYYFKFGFATLEDIIINSGSKIEIDFTSLPHAVTNITFSIYSGSTVVQSGSLTCTGKKCSATLSAAYNLKNEFVMDLTGTTTEFNMIYNSQLTAKFYNSSGRSLISQTYPVNRTSNDYSVYVEDSDIGLSSSLKLFFNTLTLNSSAYDIIFTFGDFARISSTFFSQLTINSKKIASTKLTINTTNNTLTVSAINFDTDSVQRFSIDGLYLGPYKSGWNTINFNLKQSSVSVYSKDISIYTNMNNFSLKDVFKTKISTGYRFNITFAYDYPIYSDHFFRFGLPKQYQINTADWFRGTQIPYTTAPSLSLIDINMSANLTYYKIRNLLSRTDSKASYSLIFDTTVQNIASTGDYVEVDIFSDYSSISGLDNISSSYKISTSASKTINQKCPLGCYQCNGNPDICITCSSSLTYNSTDGLCYQANQMNLNITNTNDNTDGSNIEYLFTSNRIETFNKILIAITANFCILIIVLGLFLKLFYFEGAYLLEFLCASLTLVYSMITYLFLLRIIAELPKRDYRLELIYIISSISCYIFVNLFVTTYVYVKNRHSNILNNKLLDNIIAKAFLFLICSVLGVGICLLFNSFHLLNLFRKLYCDEKDVKLYRSVSLIIKWIASFTILLLSASSTLIYYISPVRLPFIYCYFVGSLLLFVAHLVSILHLNNSKEDTHKLYDTKFNNEKSSMVMIRKGNLQNESDNYFQADDVSKIENSELNSYLDRLKEAGKNV